jgi:hypothetical protein
MRTPDLQELSLELDSKDSSASTLLGMHLVTTGDNSSIISLPRSWINLPIDLRGRSGYEEGTGLTDTDKHRDFLEPIARMVPTLRELDLGKLILSFDQFKDIIRLFESSPALSALHLPIDELAPEVFLFTSNALPHLKRFTVRYHIIKSISSPHDQSRNGWYRPPARVRESSLSTQICKQLTS